MSSRGFMDTHTSEQVEQNFEASLDLAVDELPLRDKRLWISLWGVLEMALDRIEKLEERVQKLESERAE